MSRHAHWLFAAALSIATLVAGCSGNGDDETTDPFTVTFPSSFLWGSANSAYQSEGNFQPGGGRVQSNWSRWEDLGRIKTGETNDRGADFYDRYDADFGLAEHDGHNAIRLGVEWARIEPQRGVFDAAAMDHYVQVIDAARGHGLNPVVTLYHWVVPLWVEDPSTGVDAFAEPVNHDLWDRFDEYVRYVVARIGDRVDYYVPFNEPFSVVSAGYLVGEHPPGKAFDLAGATNYLANVAFMHARAYRTIRELDHDDADGDGRATMIGMANIANPFYPKDPNNPGDVKGAQTLSYIVNELLNNALVHGDLDLTLDGDTDDSETVPPEGNYPELAGTLDYMGINYYGPVRVVEFGPPIYGYPLLSVDDYDPLLPHNGLGTEISAPDFRVALDLYARYGLPLLITENGTDTREYDQRAMYLMEHVYVLGQAIKDGLPVLGYLHWSLTDNFEWAEGYASRFGLYRIDYDTPDFARMRTSGADALQAIIRGNRIDRTLYEQYVADRYPSDQRPAAMSE